MGVIEVEIGPGATGTFTVQVVNSAAGEATETIALDVDSLLGRRNQLQAVLLASSVRSRVLVDQNERLVREVGQELFTALLGSGAVAGRYQAAAALADEHGEGLRVVLRIEDPKLTGLPWEAMYDPSPHRGGYVCHREQLVRRVPVARVPPPLTVQPPLRILAIASSPRGLPPLDVEKEKDQLTHALDHLTAIGQVEVHWAAQATWWHLQDLLLDRRQTWHVVHFIGHGDFDAQRDTGVLALVGEDGRANLVQAEQFVVLLRQARPMPRLVVLNSCSGAQTGQLDLFAGTAAALVRGGVSAVAAMQFEISDLAAIEFGRGFYTAIAHGRGIDDAVSSGRTAIIGLGGRTLEWVTPVLYLRGGQTLLFTLSTPDPHDVRRRTGRDTDEPALDKPTSGAPSSSAIQTEVEPPEPPQRPGGDAGDAPETTDRLSPADPVPAAGGDITIEDSREEKEPAAERLVRPTSTWTTVYTFTDHTRSTWATWGWISGLVRILEHEYEPAHRRLRGCAGVEAAVLDLWRRVRLTSPAWAAVVPGVVFSPDGRLLASAGADTTVQLLDPVAGRHLRTLTHPKAVPGVVFSPDGRLLASAGVDTTVRLWDPATGTHLRTLTGHTNWVTAVAFSPDGRLLASAGVDTTVRLWDPATGTHLHTLTHPTAVLGVVFSPDGHLIASAGADTTVQLWDTAPIPRILTGHTDGVTSVAFSPDGHLLASAGRDNTVRLWDPATGMHLRTLTGHTDRVTSVAFSPDGHLLASAGRDDTVRLWTPITDLTG